MYLEVGFMLQNKKHNWYDNDFSYGSARPMVQVQPSEPLPFYPRSCGCFSYNRGFRRVENGAHKPMVHLFWGISGSGSFETVHGNFRFCGGDFFYLLPFESWTIVSAGSPWRYRWLTFDGVFAQAFMEAYGIPRHPIAAGKCPEDLFEEFEQGLHCRTTGEWRNMIALVCRILAYARDRNESERHSQKILADAQDFCRILHGNPDFNVNSLAEHLNLNRVSLFRIFRSELGVTPSDYIADLRCSHALELLRYTELPLREIVSLCGFSDQAYFCRCMKKRFEKTPSALRNGDGG